ncbi:hypothetical protein PanWU01x14_324890 [Parasponia andersonii]|uniref:Uncharacterized protein n=1 Tax=Parasponia andersonii TaxID=3476 RepID=A0A2P5AK03_PARAD|nr:hypothetical protein PanWU01x14_324890 [Parasponia andersonii]
MEPSFLTLRPSALISYVNWVLWLNHLTLFHFAHQIPSDIRPIAASCCSYGKIDFDKDLTQIPALPSLPSHCYFFTFIREEMQDEAYETEI